MLASQAVPQVFEGPRLARCVKRVVEVDGNYANRKVGEAAGFSLKLLVTRARLLVACSRSDGPHWLSGLWEPLELGLVQGQARQSRHEFS